MFSLPVCNRHKVYLTINKYFYLYFYNPFYRQGGHFHILFTKPMLAFTFKCYRTNVEQVIFRVNIIIQFTI